ncbi:MAG TPA: hypothetical protein VGR79_03720 [Stellaceae bacterium]|nr:hypothetical protein [Stellaceae bacterium]
MTHQVLVIGHADADGHLIAEQTRRNLAKVRSFDVSVVVDPARTLNHTAWMHLDRIPEIDRAEYVFFVDMMFAPSTYAEEARALTDFARSRPAKRFFLIDHHPLPLQRLEAADNLRVAYRADVAECAIGPRTGMMVVAALCEPQPSDVARTVKEPVHVELAKGMKRAAAPGGPLPGEKLSALLKADRWDDLLKLSRDDAQFHYLPRGRRPHGSPQSKTLKALEREASDLLVHTSAAKSKPKVRTPMAYDANIGSEQLSYDTGRPVLQRNMPPSPKDLGVIATLLEVAALSLTTAPGKVFTLEELVREARNFGGPNVDLDEKDVKIVLLKQSFVQKVAGGYTLKG